MADIDTEQFEEFTDLWNEKTRVLVDLFNEKKTQLEVQEQQRLEAERLEKERKELEEKQRLEKERLEKERKALEEEKRLAREKAEIESEANANQNQYRGATFEFRAGCKTFDFSKIKEVKIAKDNVKELEQKYKQAFEMKQKGMTAIDESTGEIITELPTVKYAKSSIIVKLPKE